MAEQLDDMAFPDAEDVVIAYLQAELDVDGGPDVERVAPEDIDTETPDTVSGPVLRVLRVGGTDDGIDDRARMQVVVFHPSHRRARALSARIRKLMAGDYGIGGLNSAEVEVAGRGRVFVGGCSTDVAPERLPGTNPKLKQDPAYYRVLLPAQ